MSYRNNTSWLEEYEKLMFGPSHSEQTMSQAADIKYQYMPNMFFKYRSCSESAFEALEQDFLFLLNRVNSTIFLKVLSRLSVKRQSETFTKKFITA